MRFLADENIELEIVDSLREKGYKVEYITEISPGAADEYVYRRANQQIQF